MAFGSFTNTCIHISGEKIDAQNRQLSSLSHYLDTHPELDSYELLKLAKDIPDAKNVNAKSYACIAQVKSYVIAYDTAMGKSVITTDTLDGKMQSKIDCCRELVGREALSEAKRGQTPGQHCYTVVRLHSVALITITINYM